MTARANEYKKSFIGASHIHTARAPPSFIIRSVELRPESAERLAYLVEQLRIKKIHRHIFLCADQTKPECAPKEEGLASWNYLKKEIGRTGTHESGKRHLSYEGELSSHLTPGADCGGLSRGHVVSLGDSRSARAHHSRTPHRRPARPGVRVRGKRFRLSGKDWPNRHCLPNNERDLVHLSGK